METTTLLAVALILLIFWICSRGRDPRLPPCPTRPLPFVGHLFALNRDPRGQFKKWRKQCGDIFSLYMAGNHVVVLNGYDVIKEALAQRAEVFSDRPYLFFDKATGYPAKGVAFSNGTEWKEQRAVAMTILRTLGLGKNIMAEKIQEEVSIYIDFLASLKDQPTNIYHQTAVCICNMVCSIIIGQRFDYEDSNFQNIISKIPFVFSEQQNGNLLNFVPWLQYLPGDFFHAKKISANFKALVRQLRKIIDEKNKNRASFSEENDFIIAYVSEMDRRVKAGKGTFMDIESLTKIILELFTAGTDTSTNTLYWYVLYMVNNLDVQEKVYSEIVSVVGKDRPPTLEDKPNLNYLNATIMEIQRLVSLAPLALSHMCSKDVTLRGYRLPKGTLIFPNLDSVHHDKSLWGQDVMTFRPERFLDHEGQVVSREELIPFGVGRRICLGENLAKMELFLLCSSMLQKFKFLPPNPVSPPPTDYVFGYLVSPQQYQVVLKERK